MNLAFKRFTSECPLNTWVLKIFTVKAGNFCKHVLLPKKILFLHMLAVGRAGAILKKVWNISNYKREQRLKKFENLRIFIGKKLKKLENSESLKRLESRKSMKLMIFISNSNYDIIFVFLWVSTMGPYSYGFPRSLMSNFL